MHSFATVNYIAALVAALAGFVIGWIWYGPLFQKPWMQLTGMTKEKGAQSSMALTMGTAYLLNLISGIGLSMLIGRSGGWLTGLHTGLMVGVFFVATALGVIYLFEQRPLKLYFINAGYQLVNLAAIGTIIGVWP
jgi:Protein of unknown function (DUF1761)